MRIFYSRNFTGHFRGATAAIVLADTEAEATLILDRKLVSEDLKFDGTLVEISSDTSQAIILRNGDY